MMMMIDAEADCSVPGFHSVFGNTYFRARHFQTREAILKATAGAMSLQRRKNPAFPCTFFCTMKGGRLVHRGDLYRGVGPLGEGLVHRGVGIGTSD